MSAPSFYRSYDIEVWFCAGVVITGYWRLRESRGVDPDNNPYKSPYILPPGHNGTYIHTPTLNPKPYSSPYIHSPTPRKHQQVRSGKVNDLG